MKKAKLNEDICLGRGLCVRACGRNNILLKPRPKRAITPPDGMVWAQGMVARNFAILRSSSAV